MVVEGQDVAARRDLQVHRRPLPVLQERHATMAEFFEAQLVLQRLLYQGQFGTVYVSPSQRSFSALCFAVKLADEGKRERNSVSPRDDKMIDVLSCKPQKLF